MSVSDLNNLTDLNLSIPLTYDQLDALAAESLLNRGILDPIVESVPSLKRSK